MSYAQDASKLSACGENCTRRTAYLHIDQYTAAICEVIPVSVSAVYIPLHAAAPITVLGANRAQNHCSWMVQVCRRMLCGNRSTNQQHEHVLGDYVGCLPAACELLHTHALETPYCMYSRMPMQCCQLLLWLPHVPDFYRLVNGPRCNNAVVILAPVS